MSAVTARLEGLDGALRKLASLKAAVRNKLSRQAVNAGAKLVQAEVKARAPVGETGALRMSIGRKVQTYRGSGTTVGLVGPQTGFARKGKGKKSARRQTKLGAKLQALGANPSKYAHLVEKGTRPHAIGKGSRLRKRRQIGRMHPGARAKPFEAPAYQATAVRAAEAVAQSLAEGIQREASR